MSGQLLLGGAPTVLLVLALPLKPVGGFEAVLIAMLLRLRGLVERDEEHDPSILEDETLAPDRCVVGKAQERGNRLTRVLPPFLRRFRRGGLAERHELRRV